MENSNFSQSTELLVLNQLKCLRNDYYHNDCTICIEQCDKEALTISYNKLKLIDDKCTSCGECIGCCPTQSFSMETFDVADFILNFFDNDKEIIIEKNDIPTFGMLDEHYLVSIVLRKKTDLTLEYDEASTLNIQNYINEKISISNSFLSKIGCENKIKLIPHKKEVEQSRRGLFKNLFNSTKELKKEEKTSKTISKHKMVLPPKYVLFKNSLKLYLKEDDTKIIETNNELVFNKMIDTSCTKCNDCIVFCPTNALILNNDETHILYNSGDCIGCDICHDICKPNSIKKTETIDVIDYAFDHITDLIGFEYVKCEECNQPFATCSDEKICKVCKQGEHLKNMFTLARDK